jgi:hypothetical protein
MYKRTLMGQRAALCCRPQLKAAAGEELVPPRLHTHPTHSQSCLPSPCSDTLLQYCSKPACPLHLTAPPAQLTENTAVSSKQPGTLLTSSGRERSGTLARCPRLVPRTNGRWSSSGMVLSSAAGGWLNDQRSAGVSGAWGARALARCCTARPGRAAAASAAPPPSPPRAAARGPRPAEIGLGLAAFGFLFTVLGIMMFFDRGLLAMGNVSSAGLASGRRRRSAGPRTPTVVAGLFDAARASRERPGPLSPDPSRARPPARPPPRSCCSWRA